MRGRARSSLLCLVDAAAAFAGSRRSDLVPVAADTFRPVGFQRLPAQSHSGARHCPRTANGYGNAYARTVFYAYPFSQLNAFAHGEQHTHAYRNLYLCAHGDGNQDRRCPRSGPENDRDAGGSDADQKTKRPYRHSHGNAYGHSKSNTHYGLFRASPPQPRSR